MKTLSYPDLKGQNLKDQSKTDFLIKETKSFWDRYPCEGKGSYEERKKNRYKRNPFVIRTLKEYLFHYNHILEIGCGLGTDAMTLCQLWEENSKSNSKSKGEKNEGEKNTEEKTYIGVDLSSKSIQMAEQWLAGIPLKIRPQFKIGKADSLEFADESFDCVYSSGVFHHVPNIERAILETYRVLKKGGTAHLYLYKRYSIRILGAYLLRSFTTFPSLRKKLVKFLDWIGTNHYFGTMFHEGFLTPILNSYTKKELEELFSRFSWVEIKKTKNPWLYFHVIARKG